MTQPAILVLQPLPDTQMERLRAAYEIHEAPSPEVRAVVTDGHRGLDAATIAALPGLEIVASGSAGVEGIDRAALDARGVPLVNAAPALADDVADLAVLLALAAWKRLLRGDAFVRSGEWEVAGTRGMGADAAREAGAPLTRTLTGRRLGLLGMGTIGQAIAPRAAAFGLEVAYHARHPRDVPWRHEPDLPALAAWADILVVIVPGGAATRRLVSAEVIAALGPEGVLVNVARGSVVDEAALIAALEAGRLGGAGLDVFASEPDVDARLRRLPNVVLSPHAGSATVETREAMAALVVDNLAAHFAGRPLLSRI
jgi:hydroxypyruvate reductase